MRSCPVCRRQFPDDLTFCLEDGTPLVDDAAPSMVTAYSPRVAANAARPARQSRTFAYVIAIGLFLIGGLVLLAAGVGGYWYYKSTERTAAVPYPSNTNTNNTQSVPATNSPRPPSTPSEPPPSNTNARKPTPSPSNQTAPSVKIDPETNTYPAPETKDPGDRKPVPKQISGGVLNGKATSLPKPPYPPAARAVRASGSVAVQVLVDESGSVVSARALSGHPLLRASAVQAARSAKFNPTILAGQPVKVSGVIMYNFVP